LPCFVCAARSNRITKSFEGLREDYLNTFTTYNTHTRLHNHTDNMRSIIIGLTTIAATALGLAVPQDGGGVVQPFPATTPVWWYFVSGCT
jgi:hypothetical protein